MSIHINLLKKESRKKVSLFEKICMGIGFLGCCAVLASKFFSDYHDVSLFDLGMGLVRRRSWLYQQWFVGPGALIIIETILILSIRIGQQKHTLAMAIGYSIGIIGCILASVIFALLSMCMRYLPDEYSYILLTDAITLGTLIVLTMLFWVGLRNTVVSLWRQRVQPVRIS